MPKKPGRQLPRLTGAYRYRVSWLGKLIMQIEEEFVSDWRGQLSPFTAREPVMATRWRDARVEDVTRIEQMASDPFRSKTADPQAKGERLMPDPPVRPAAKPTPMTRLIIRALREGLRQQADRHHFQITVDDEGYVDRVVGDLDVHWLSQWVVHALVEHEQKQTRAEPPPPPPDRTSSGKPMPTRPAPSKPF